MRSEDLLARYAAKTFTPLLVLFAIYLLITRGPGEGVGFAAGGAFAAGFALFTLSFGLEAARVAFPGWAIRVALGVGAVVCGLGGLGVGGPIVEPARVGEAGLFLVSVGGLCGVIYVLVGRAPTLRDENW